MKAFSPWDGRRRRAQTQSLPPVLAVSSERMPTPAMLKALRKGNDRKLVRLVQAAAIAEQLPLDGVQ